MSDRTKVTGTITYDSTETIGHKVGTAPATITETKRAGRFTLEMTAEPEDFAGMAEGASAVAKSILDASQSS